MGSRAGGEPLSGEDLRSGAPVPSSLCVQNSPLHIHYPRLPHHMLTMGDTKPSTLPFCLVVHIPSGSIHLLDSPQSGFPFRDAAKTLGIHNMYLCPSSWGGWERGSCPGGFWGCKLQVLQ